ncbi:MAG: ATP-binding cassette domain-containing protein [Lachnospiraceae bacterium]|nr:ATP-binding cassette domain-containing protein [Lachnospiraceae bacterium]
MKLLYNLSGRGKELLSLMPDENVLYCVPVDLMYEPKENADLKKEAAGTVKKEFKEQAYLAVTGKKIAVVLLEGKDVAGRILFEKELKDCKKIRCEHQVGCGIVTVTDKNENDICVARVSMKQIVRTSYAVRGAQEIIRSLEENGDVEGAEKIVSTEYETYCEKCGRALPGTSKCPYCGGKLAFLKKLMDLCGDYMGKILLVSVFMLINTAVWMISPMVQKSFIDNALETGKGTWADFGVFVGITFAFLLIGISMEVARNLTCVKLGSLLAMSLRERLYYKIQILSLSFVNKRKPGELMNRVSRDTARIRDFFEEVFGGMFAALFTMIVSLVLMFTISPIMTLLSLVFVLVVFVLMKVFWHHIHMIFSRQWMKSDELSNNIQDIISGMRIVKTFGTEEREAARFTEKAMDYAATSSRNEGFWSIFFPILTFLLGGGTYIAVLLGGRDVLIGKMTLGQLVQFMTYSGYLFGPLGWMTHLPRMVMQMITTVNRVYDVLDEEPRIKDNEDSKEHDIDGDFHFERVSFGYNTYEPVLENISFDVKHGEMIGLVGASGTGKSTLINLIMRLYDPDQGQILLDGIDLRKIGTESLHSQIGVVLQETFLFSGSILDNIRFAKQDATLSEVIQAAKAANAHDFICKTPDGYNTYVGEHGYNLSGGERQRIAIARAILNNPKLLILDEATSALDTESEFLIQQALNRLIQGRTTFAIAHRLSTLREADRLVVIDKHGVAEIGSHNELLEKKGIYYNLVTAQLKMAEVS